MTTTHLSAPATVAMPGGLLVRWPAVLALTVLVVNDHVLKPLFASWWTGKLSGVAAMVVVPFFVLGLLEVARRRPFSPRARSRVLAAVGTTITVAMAGVEVLPWMSDVYEVSFGVLRWPLDIVLAVASGGELPAVGRVVQTMDPTDLVTVPAGLLPWIWVRRSTTPSRGDRS